MSKVATLFASLQKGFLKNLLEGAGLTLFTTGSILLTFKGLVERFKESLGEVPTDLINLAGLSGMDIYFSLILGAVVTKHFQSAGKLSIRKKS